MLDNLNKELQFFCSKLNYECGAIPSAERVLQLGALRHYEQLGLQAVEVWKSDETWWNVT